jgi:8-oxo-dGTP pyrophosphatase MutT (NUDIX family)
MAHIHEKIDFTVSVYIVHGDRVLLRKHEKYGFWLAPGGHIELDENPVEAVIREAKEEVGLDITLVGTTPQVSEGEAYTELLPPRFMNIHKISETHRHNDLVYIARTESDEVKPSGEDISHDWKWLTRSELESNALGLRETIRHYALTALEEAGR